MYDLSIMCKDVSLKRYYPQKNASGQNEYNNILALLEGLTKTKMN